MLHGPRISTILTGRLWSGSWAAATTQSVMSELQDAGMKVIVSCMPIGQIGVFTPDVIVPRPLAHRLLFSWDDTLLEPGRIYSAINDPRPTFIHCNAGENRSTMLAACWLILHLERKGYDALSEVKRIREADLGRPPRMWDQMEQNVINFAEHYSPGRE